MAGKRNKLVSRISEMEVRFDRLGKILAGLEEALCEYKGFADDLAILRDYMASGQWQKDFEADEAGRIPSEVKRGILSEDGLYDLLQDADRILAEAREILA